MAPDVQTPLETFPPPETPAKDWTTQFPLPPELIPDFTDIAIETDEPVESYYAEHLYRLLTEPLYTSWLTDRPFIASANVGLFYKYKHPPLVPDVMLSVDIGDFTFDPSRKEHNTYVVWEVGKPPDVVIELVSDRRGGEAGLKMKQYAKIGVSYYVIVDPEDLLGHGLLRCFELHGRQYQPRLDCYFPDVGLGIVPWQGTYERSVRQWVRWRDAEGKLIPTGKEVAEQASQRAEQERQRANAIQLQMEQERQRAEQELKRRLELEAKLKSMGIDPSA